MSEKSLFEKSLSANSLPVGMKADLRHHLSMSFVLTVLCLAAGLIFLTCAAAETGISDDRLSLSVSSEKIVFDLSGDASASSQIKISNTGNVPARLHIYFRKDGQADHAVLSVLRLSENVRTLSPGEEMMLSVTLDDPGRLSGFSEDEKSNIKLNLFYVPVRGDSAFAGGIRIPVSFNGADMFSEKPSETVSPNHSFSGGTVGSVRIENSGISGTNVSAVSPESNGEAPESYPSPVSGGRTDNGDETTDPGAAIPAGELPHHAKHRSVGTVAVLVSVVFLSLVLTGAAAFYFVRRKK